MPTRKQLLRYLRTTGGQLTLLCALLAGAVILSMTAICCRSFFERSIVEVFPSETDRDADSSVYQRCLKLSNGDLNRDAFLKMDSRERHIAYGYWINHTIADPDHRLQQALIIDRQSDVFPIIERTLVVGSEEQRLRALELLTEIDQPDLISDRHRVINYLTRRSSDRQEVRIAQRVSEFHPEK